MENTFLVTTSLMFQKTDLYQKKDYGEYAENGKMPVCFIGTNHTTGGNSGSPALDANGNLIGLNLTAFGKVQ
jgi:S1-C subfamily serine protease